MPDNQTVNFRLKLVREFLKFSQAEMADTLGIKRPNLSKIERNEPGRNVPKDTIHILEKKFNVNPEWFETGEGEMFMPVKEASRFEDTLTQYSTIQPATEETFVPRPVINSSARASFIESYLNETLYEPMASFPVLKTAYANDLYIVEVVGNSMETELRDGDKILARNITDKNQWPFLTGVVAVMHNNNFNVKRVIVNELNVNGTLTLVSDNPKGGTYTVKQEDLIAIMTYEDLVSRKDKR